MTKRYVGSPVKVLDSPRLLTGRGKYVDDLTFPRMVHVAFLRSPHAHARITRLDVEPARKAAGVVAVVTGEDADRDRLVVARADRERAQRLAQQLDRFRRATRLSLIEGFLAEADRGRDALGD